MALDSNDMQTTHKGRGFNNLSLDLDKIISENPEKGEILMPVGAWGDAAAMTAMEIQNQLGKEGYDVQFGKEFQSGENYVLPIIYSKKLSEEN